MTFHTKLSCVQNHCVFDSKKIYDGIRYLILFASERYNAIYDKINYLISEKSDITHSNCQNLARISIDSYNSSPIGKILIFHTHKVNC